MFINKAPDGTNNLCANRIRQLRIDRGLSQRRLAELLQLQGLDIDKNAIQRIEAGKRFVTDIELRALSVLFQRSADELLAKI